MSFILYESNIEAGLKLSLFYFSIHLPILSLILVPKILLLLRYETLYLSHSIAF